VKYTFGKAYKLCSKTLLTEVYDKGKEIKEIPFIVRFVEAENPKGVPFQIVFVVPKRKFRNATTRNQIRRYIREAVRLNKHMIEEPLEQKNQHLALFLLYVGYKEVTFHDIDKKIKTLFKRLAHEIEAN
jgi:ribonuclease P protein component